MKSPKGTVVHLRESQKMLEMRQTIDTMRLLLAVCVHRHGVFNRLTLTADEIAAVREGNLVVTDRPNGDIVLGIKGVAPKLTVHG